MKQQAIIVDLDGTLCDNSYRVQYVDGSQKKDWDKFNALSANDPVVEWCLDLVKGFDNQGYHIVFLTARQGTDSTKKITEEWLDRNVKPYVPHYSLVMRDVGDYRTDFITKQDLYMQKVAPFYDVAFAIDDKLSVCQMWRSLGIAALHCKD